MTLAQLRRVRHGARAALALGVMVSIVANILHAQADLISQAIAAWAPIALLLTIELIARVPIRRGWASLARLLATATIAAIAAWVSYWHMVGVALRYGEETGAAHLIPLTVDGLVVVAWVCLAELAGRIRDIEGGSGGDQLGEARPEGERGDHRSGGPGVSRPGESDPEPATEGRAAAGGGDLAPVGEGPETHDVAAPAARVEPPTSPRRKAHTANPERVERAWRRTPDARPEEIARRLNLSPATVKRYRPPVAGPEQVNGKVPDLEGVN